MEEGMTRILLYEAFFDRKGRGTKLVLKKIKTFLSPVQIY